MSREGEILLPSLYEMEASSDLQRQAQALKQRALTSRWSNSWFTIKRVPNYVVQSDPLMHGAGCRDQCDRGNLAGFSIKSKFTKFVKADVEDLMPLFAHATINYLGPVATGMNRT